MFTSGIFPRNSYASLIPERVSFPFPVPQERTHICRSIAWHSILSLPLQLREALRALSASICACFSLRSFVAWFFPSSKLFFISLPKSFQEKSKIPPKSGSTIKSFGRLVSFEVISSSCLSTHHIRKFGNGFTALLLIFTTSPSHPAERAERSRSILVDIIAVEFEFPIFMSGWVGSAKYHAHVSLTRFISST